jgi:hypothetical protein
MSLASRMSSLFTTTTTSTTTSADGSSHPSSSNSSTGVAQAGSIHDDNLQGVAEFGISRKNKRVKVMGDGDGGEELESRPPYLHVCGLNLFLPRSVQLDIYPAFSWQRRRV